MGVARVEGKAVVGRILYLCRIFFKPLFILGEEKWETGRVVVKDLNVSVRAICCTEILIRVSMNKVVHAIKFEK